MVSLRTTTLALPTLRPLRTLAKIFFRDVNGMSISLLFNLTLTLIHSAMYRRTLDDTEKTDYIDAVKCLQSRPALEPRSISAIQSRFDDFQAVHIQLADKVHLTVGTSIFHDVNRKCVFLNPQS
jgi:hypothetical protein